MQPEVRDWFARRTSRAANHDRARLVAAKGGQTVSVVLPALDEAATIGPIVEGIRAELIEDIPLVDELLVVDAGSADDTAVVAADAGAWVLPEADLLPQFGRIPGKGDALWKSLFATTGDLVVFLDGDVTNFSPQWVVALLGPLLTDPQVHLVKAAYDRPLSTDGMLRPGGGRVTELVARPLLAAHWPELAGVGQPLAGEYAGRRALLEALPFTSGYGVEFGLLVDVLEAVGLDAIAQVDLGRRVHRNQSDAALGRMAAAIWQTALGRLERQDRLVCTEPPATELTQFSRDETGGYQLSSYDVSVRGRPPMRAVPEYRERLARVE